MNISVFPNEIILHIITFLPLCSLIRARGINHAWHDLVDTAHIHPSRRKLVNLYLEAIALPSFRQSRPRYTSYLSPFSRTHIVERLEARYHYLPDDFRIWLLEWPERAVSIWIWPGLPSSLRSDTGEPPWVNHLNQVTIRKTPSSPPDQIHVPPNEGSVDDWVGASLLPLFSPSRLGPGVGKATWYLICGKPQLQDHSWEVARWTPGGLSLVGGWIECLQMGLARNEKFFAEERKQRALGRNSRGAKLVNRITSGVRSLLQR